MAITQSHDFFVQWHLTERCNLRCAHCYQESTLPGEMTYAEVLEVMDEVTEMIDDWSDAYGIEFSKCINVTGGEPFLRKDIFTILRELRRRGFELSVLSNGTLIEGDTARRLSEIGVKGVQISIEGPEEVHEYFRGKGSFSEAMSGVEKLLEADLAVTLNATLSKINAPHFVELVVLAREAGVQKLGFSRLVPSGRGRNLGKDSLEKEQLRHLYDAIFSLDQKDLELVTGDPVASQFTFSDAADLGSTALGGCAAGVSGLTILSDGTVLPCRRLPVSLGNVREDSIREIWATSEVLNSIRDKSKYRGKCATCNRWAACRGCRGIAYAHYGNILSEDPGCFIRARNPDNH